MKQHAHPARRAIQSLLAIALTIAIVGGCSPSYKAEYRSSESVGLAGDAVQTSALERRAITAMSDSVAGKRSIPAAQASMLPLPSATALNPVFGATPATPVQPHLVKNVDMAIQVEDVQGQSAALQKMANELGGYLANLTEITQPVLGTQIRLTLRIPAVRLDETVASIETLGEVLSRNLTTQDVTLQYVDMQSRLRNLEKTEGRLLVHLERAGEMKDILDVEKEITRVRVEIETIQGRIKDLANQISYATVHVSLTSVPTAGPITPAVAFSTSRTFTDALRNLIQFSQGLWVIAIWIGVWSPLWIPLTLLVGFLYRRQNRIAEAARQSQGKTSAPN